MPFKFLVIPVHYGIAIKQHESSRGTSKPGRGETRIAPALGSRSIVPSQATAPALEQSLVSRLARFFPEATPVRIPIKLSRSSVNDDQNSDKNDKGVGESRGRVKVKSNENVFVQDTVIEFGTPHEVLFMVDRPLEFADRVLVESSDGWLHAEASVVAVQYYAERTAVAVRFLKQVPNWIVKS